MPERKKIAAIATTYYPFSHADVIISKFLKGFPTDGELQPPQVDIVSMYMDQQHERDVGLDLARECGVEMYYSIPSALCLGGKELAVDGVLIIGEHGDYAWNEKEQHLYPRRYFFEQACGVFATSGRAVPGFTDKHLSLSIQQAKWMCDRARELDVPFMAGSSLPVTYRQPWLEHGLETPIEEALSVAYGGLDSYGFHALETLQCMVERRKGGETGIAAVQCLEGAAVWAARDAGRWSGALGALALEQVESVEEGPLEELCKEPAVFLLEYADGLQAATLMANGFQGGMQSWGYAATIAGQPQACEFYLHGDPHPHFSYLGLNIQAMLLTDKPQYPVERTLLVSGALEALMDSRYRGHVRLETPHLDVAYTSYETSPIRPETGRPRGAAIEPWRPE
ncbi:MAG: hypothetical protein VX293_05930 [Candidatus Latescibacterota bacterium]|nr:hypothetical protein [Candidatus Latescibacterota bacterium]